MSKGEADKFGKHIGEIAETFLQASHGAPNKALSTKSELRFGKKGSFSVDLQRGAWHDHELNEGGGALDLIMMYGNMEKGEAIQWMEDRGLLEKREMDEKPKEKFLGFMEHHPVATFQYMDRKGKLAFEVLKFPKDAPRRYMQRRPDGNGGWVFGLQEGEYGKGRNGLWFKAKEDKRYEEKRHWPDAERFLYRYDEVKAAIKAKEPIILVEGEKDVETLRDWGFTATTNAGGAKFWVDAFDEDLRGADIIICGDNDDASRQRTLLRGASLRLVAKSVRVIDMRDHWKGIQEKDDVSDWKERGKGSADAFAEIMEKAKLWKPEPIPSKFKAMTWSEVGEKAADFEYLVNGWIPLDGTSVMAGASQAGKSFLSLHMALCVARGIPFFDQPVERRGVIYQAGEGGSGAKKRIMAYRKHFDVSAEDDVPLVFMPAKVDLFSKEGDTQALIDEINAHKLMMNHPLGLVVIDTLATATAGADENSGKDMGMVLANVAKIAEATGAHVMLVHHMNADGKKLRGHTSILANVDTAIIIENNEEGIRTANLFKQKDDDNTIKLHFGLAPITVGTNEKTGLDVTSCVVVTRDERDIIRKKNENMGMPISKKHRAIMTRFFEAQKKYGVYASGSNPDHPKESFGKMAFTWHDYIEVAIEMEIDDDGSVDSIKKANERLKKEWQREKEELKRMGIIELSRPFMWWTGKPIRGFPETLPKKRERDQIAAHEEYTSPGLDEALSDEKGVPF